MNLYAFIEPASCHPNCCHEATVKGIRQRIWNRCTSRKDIEKEITFFESKFQARGYDGNLKFLTEKSPSARKHIMNFHSKKVSARNLKMHALRRALRKPSGILANLFKRKVGMQVSHTVQKNLFRLNYRNSWQSSGTR